MSGYLGRAVEVRVLRLTGKKFDASRETRLELQGFKVLRGMWGQKIWGSRLKPPLRPLV